MARLVGADALCICQGCNKFHGNSFGKKSNELAVFRFQLCSENQFAVSDTRCVGWQ